MRSGPCLFSWLFQSQPGLAQKGSDSQKLHKKWIKHVRITYNSFLVLFALKKLQCNKIIVLFRSFYPLLTLNLQFYLKGVFIDFQNLLLEVLYSIITVVLQLCKDLHISKDDCRIHKSLQKCFPTWHL